ncbi:MAG: hypothetical protein MUO62_01410, partial [Anaerolineales bacterium]|nr:hypothetical protein [Anaerolineales bacterium]
MTSPTVKSTLPAAVPLAVSGWLGLAYLILKTLPTLGPRWLFFFFSVLAVSGMSLPLVAFLNRRFPSQPQAGLNAIVREGSLM